MSNNPYQPPLPIAGDPQIDRPGTRPAGTAILAVLHLIGGLLIGALGVFLVTQFDEEDSNSIVA